MFTFLHAHIPASLQTPMHSPLFRTAACRCQVKSVCCSCCRAPPSAAAAGTLPQKLVLDLKPSLTASSPSLPIPPPPVAPCPSGQEQVLAAAAGNSVFLVDRRKLAVDRKGDFLAAADDSGQVKVISLINHSLHRTLRGVHSSTFQLLSSLPLLLSSSPPVFFSLPPLSLILHLTVALLHLSPIFPLFLSSPSFSSSLPSIALQCSQLLSSVPGLNGTLLLSDPSFESTQKFSRVYLGSLGLCFWPIPLLIYPLSVIPSQNLSPTSSLLSSSLPSIALQCSQLLSTCSQLLSTVPGLSGTSPLADPSAQSTCQQIPPPPARPPPTHPPPPSRLACAILPSSTLYLCSTFLL
ncbi:unnamed protein product [Closterium sp. NIES-64]|nr:unnamed protein product [Closterium sp. NIES-64]